MTQLSAHDFTQNQAMGLAQRYDLIAKVLAAPAMNGGAVAGFRELLNGEFMQWVAQARLGSVGAEALLRMQAVLDQLELLASAPHFCRLNLLAVAGGFSSGKSSLICSLMEDGSPELPVGIEPVTSIPTYVIPGPAGTVRGYTSKGGVVEIDKTLYASLSHRNVGDFGFNLRDILPFAAIETPLRGLKHLALLDLPGFGAPSSSGSYTQDDSALALEFLTQAGAVLWVVGLDVNGTLPLSDLMHLHEIARQDLPFFVVLNKADLKPRSDVAAVINHVNALMREQGLKPAGLCAYSSVLRMTYGHKGKTLAGFLRGLDFELDRGRDLVDQVSNVFRRIQTEHRQHARDLDSGLSQVKQLEIDLTELGLFDQGIPHDDLLGLGGRRRKRRLETIASSSWNALCTIEELIQAAATDGYQQHARSMSAAFKALIRQACNS